MAFFIPSPRFRCMGASLAVSPQRLGGADLCTFVAKNTLRSVFALAGLFVYLHVHGADPEAFVAVDAFVFVTVDPQEGQIAHGLEKHGDGAEVFAEGPVVPEQKSQTDARQVVKPVSCQKEPEHDFL